MNESTKNDTLRPDESPDHDELVAYLDGEVSAAERERIEQRMSDDEAYRTQWIALERSWRMLDRLPTTAHDESFTKTTIAMVSAELKDPTSSANGGARNIPWAKLLAAVAACAIGYFAIMMPARNRELQGLRDLPVAQNLELYRYAENLEFLQLLHKQQSFAKTDLTTSSDLPESTELSNVDWSQTGNVKQIRTSVEQLNANQKDELANLRERFEKLSAEEQLRMRNLHKELTADPAAAELFQVLRDYRQWLTTLKAAERADLLDVQNPMERVAKIGELQDEQDIEWAGPEGHDLTRQDKEAVLEFVKSYLREHGETILSQLPNHFQERARDSRPSPFRDVMLWTLAFSEGSRRMEMGIDEEVKPPAPSAELLQRLEDSLSPAAKQKWQQAADFKSRKPLLQKWIKISIQGLRHNVTPEDLETFYLENLTSAQQDELKQLPPEEMKEKLRRWFLHSRSGGPRGGPGFRGGGGPSRGPRGEGPPRGEGGRRRGGPDEAPPK